jgi:hypothetical protein
MTAKDGGIEQPRNKDTKNFNHRWTRMVGRVTPCAPRLFSPQTGLPWQNRVMAGHKGIDYTKVQIETDFA